MDGLKGLFFAMKRNFIYTGIGIGSRLFSNLVLFVVLARYWGPADFGRFSFLYSLSALTGIVVEYGLQTYIMRELDSTDQVKSRGVLSDALCLKLLLTPIYVLIAFLAAFLSPDFREIQLFIPIVLATILSSFSEFFVAAIRASGNYDKELRVVLFGNLSQFGLAIATVALVGAPVLVVWAMVAGRTAYLLKAVISLPVSIRPQYPQELSFNALWSQICRTTAYAVDGFLTTVWTQLDLVLVNHLYGAHTTGLYAAGQRIVQGVSALAPVIGNVMLPRLATLARSADQGLNPTAVKVLLMMSLTGAVFAAPLIAAPGHLSHLLYGEKFTDLPALLPLLGALLIARFCAGGAGLVITALGLQKARVKTQTIGFSMFLLLVLIVSFLDLEITILIECLIASTLLVGGLYGFAWRRFVRGF